MYVSMVLKICPCCWMRVVWSTVSGGKTNRQRGKHTNASIDEYTTNDNTCCPTGWTDRRQEQGRTRNKQTKQSTNKHSQQLDEKKERQPLHAHTLSMHYSEVIYTQLSSTITIMFSCCWWFPWGSSTIFWLVYLLCPLFDVSYVYCSLFFFLLTLVRVSGERVEKRDGWHNHRHTAPIYLSMRVDFSFFCPPLPSSFFVLSFPQPHSLDNWQLTIKAVRFGPIPEVIFSLFVSFFLFSFVHSPNNASKVDSRYKIIK